MIEIPSNERRLICRQQKWWIADLQEISIKPVKLADTWQDGITPGQRMNADTYHWMFPYQYRECLHNEIPYDLDIYDWEVMKLAVEPTFSFLCDNKIPFIMGGSGGTKSIHIQLFFPPSISCIRYGWRDVRFALWHWILDQAEIPDSYISKNHGIIQGMRGNGKRSDGIHFAYDLSVANFSDMAQARVMRDYGGMARGKKWKSLLSQGEYVELPSTREMIYDGVTRFPDKPVLWEGATKLIEDELELGYIYHYPDTCIECPISYESMMNLVEYPHQDPEICRRCGNIWK